MFVLLRRLQIDSVACQHEENGLVYQILGQSSLDCNLAAMLLHVAALNSLDTHGAECGEVLCQAYRCHDLGNLIGARVPHDLVRVNVGRIGRNGSAFGPYRDWKLQPALQDAVHDFVVGERAVAALEGCKGVS